MRSVSFSHNEGDPLSLCALGEVRDMRTDDLVVDTVAEDLSRRFGGAVPRDLIRQTAQECLQQWPDARISDFVPILATKCARERLRERGYGSVASHGQAPALDHMTAPSS